MIGLSFLLCFFLVFLLILFGVVGYDGRRVDSPAVAVMTVCSGGRRLGIERAMEACPERVNLIPRGSYADPLLHCPSAYLFLV